MKIVLIGKTNVGKSTLFNKIIEKNKAIISKEVHTTRDRIYGECQWRGKNLTFIDVGGITKEKISDRQKILEKEIQKQIEIALEEAEIILFLLDAQKEITLEDRIIAQKIKKLKKKIILVINKVDNLSLREEIKKKNFLKLGFGQPIFVSAANGSGVGDLLDEIIKKIKKIPSQKYTPQRKEPFKIAIVGRTNVGKSTLVNSILGEERVIVTPLPHTTREPVDSYFSYQGQNFLLIDTAGMRKKTKVKSEIERVGIIKSLKMIEKSDIVLLIIDLCERISKIDKKLADLAKENKKGIILVINKFDLAQRPFKEYLNYYQNQFLNLWWVPIVFISAKEKINLDKLLEQILLIKEKMKIKLKKKELNFLLKEIIETYHFNQKYWSEVKIFSKKDKIPNIIIKIPKLTAKEIPPTKAQINILEKKIREKFELWGVPINLEIKN